MLIKSVIASKPIHQLLIADAPDWLLDEAHSWMGAFLWVGKKKVNGGQCHVAWDNVCSPLGYGGLGIKNLKLHGLALRARWEWLRRMDNSRTWQGLRMLRDPEAESVFKSLATIKLGSGNQVMFWSDRWINGFSVGDLAPTVLKAVSKRIINKRTVAQSLVDSSWVSDVSRPLNVQGIVESVKIWLAINNIQLSEDEPDSLS